ncbi:MAG: adenylate/guanylate cyclase domain-containing protein, partial [Acidobacteria bacterium]|nr:adenylate/guanylate cyclase domain-containing protein [Acidobacteriota bacterium]
MVEIVMRNQGTLDKFIGDGLMVIFGAPVEDPYQEEHAVRAALEMQQEFSQLSKKWQLQGPATRIGVGINSGNAIVGNIGSTRAWSTRPLGTRS